MPLLDWSVDCTGSSHIHLDLEQKYWLDVGFFDGTGFGHGSVRDLGRLDGTSLPHPEIDGYPDGEGFGDGFGDGYGLSHGFGNGWGSGDGDGGLDGSGLG